ncbi:MAG TPA: hypothetical protein DHW31_01680 [Bacteroides graminisolvens]|uniref:Uncharacterized protein n=1 Tax=Bacteroides graminisolvens TaxID=477666 RepID=A0A3D2SDT7_9BACE|nr:hypothetical protein [Bacteroides graminisolvens]
MDKPLFRLQRLSVNLRLRGLFLAFFCDFILFVLTVFRFGEWLLFMQQPFCTDALMDFFGWYWYVYIEIFFYSID